LLQSLKAGDYEFISVSDHLHDPSIEKFILLRHDVEKHYENALEFAKMEKEMGMRGTYYFRFSKKHFNEAIIAKIASLGHETGYHYDDLSKCRGNYKNAFSRFKKNLDRLRQIVPVKTICMDGSPLSKYDNKDLWKKYNYKDLGILGEPYFDINFNEVGYLTDTGRRWDGEKVSVRDKVKTEDRKLNSSLGTHPSAPGTQESPYPEPRTPYHTTNDIIKAAQDGELPDRLMLTFHPQRWTDKPLPWVKELVWQNVKNQIKRMIIKK
jgi:hypothetical protein